MNPYEAYEEGDEMDYMENVDAMEDWGAGYEGGHFVIPTEERDIYVSIERVKVVGVNHHD